LSLSDGRAGQSHYSTRKLKSPRFQPGDFFTTKLTTANETTSFTVAGGSPGWQPLPPRVGTTPTEIRGWSAPKQGHVREFPGADSRGPKGPSCQQRRLPHRREQSSRVGRAVTGHAGMPTTCWLPPTQQASPLRRRLRGPRWRQ